MTAHLFAILALLGCQENPQAPTDATRPWAQWRGPDATGAAPEAAPPLEWSEAKNVRWKTPVPGTGHSTPVVWGRRIYLTTAVPVGDALDPAPDRAPGAHDNGAVTHRYEFRVLAIDRLDGELVWSKTVHTALPHERAHNTGSFASQSPVTDGELVIASFGSAGIFGLDADGELLWKKDLGDMQVKHEHGEGSSPVLSGDTLVVNWDHRGDSFLCALDKRTGEERWKVARDEVTSWATPIVVEHAGKSQLIVSGSARLRGYDLATGTVIWECGGLSQNIVASPVSAHGIVYAGSSYEKQSMLAVRLEGASGDITLSDRVLWVRRRNTPYVPSPLLYEGTLYFMHHYQGFVARVDAESGKETNRPTRLTGLGNVYASPVGAAGRIYLTDLEGTTLVMSHTAPPTILATNQLDDSFSASAALFGTDMILRGERYLYCLAELELATEH